MAIEYLDIDHFSLHVENLKESKAFYQNIMGLQEKVRPNFNFPGAWFQIGNKELHLISGREKPVHSGSRGSHTALEVADLKAAHLEISSKWEHVHPIKNRPDGIEQFFIVDPDGYWIELTQKS